MLKKGIGRVKPWQRRVSSTGSSTGPKADKAKPPPEHDLPPRLMHHDIPSHRPPHMSLPYDYSGMYAFQHHPPYSPPPPPHRYHQTEHEHYKKHHDHKHDSNGKHKGGHHDHHHGSPHPPPPPPGNIKRFFQYIFDTLKKRPLLYTFLLSNVAFFSLKKVNPETHKRFVDEVVEQLQHSSASLNINRNDDKEKIKITKLNDSLNNYSNCFRKASSGANVASALENLQASSLLRHMNELEFSLSEEKKQEIARLTEAFHKKNTLLTEALDQAAGQLRHCQLMGIAATNTNSGSDSPQEQDRKAEDNATRDQSNAALRAKFSELTMKKFALETEFIQLVCDVLDESQRELLCRDLLKNKSSSVSQLLKTPVLYPEINGLSCTKRAVFVLKFDGNLTASGVNTLRHEVTAIVENADKNRGDRVVIVLNSGGGTVGGYGLGASQLERIKAAGLHLTVCVDEVAASGGYLMACVADTVVSAPFATLGSIGVMTMIPNFHERLKREGIHVDTITAGNYKRTLTPTSKPTPENRKKLQEDLNSVHETFKSHIKKYRPEVDINKVSTGETWLGSDALKLGLCDSLSTSDDYLLQLSKSEGTEVYHVKYNNSAKNNFVQRLLQDDDESDACQSTVGDVTSGSGLSQSIARVLAQIITQTIDQVVLLQNNGHQIPSSSTSSSVPSSEKEL